MRNGTTVEKKDIQKDHGTTDDGLWFIWKRKALKGWTISIGLSLG